MNRYTLWREEVVRQLVLAQKVNGGAESGGRLPDFSLWSGKRIQCYRESLSAPLSPTLALLRIPKIHLEVPVLRSTDNLSLNRAVGHIAGTARPGEGGNIGIAGHRDSFFRGLKDVATGNQIELLTWKETDIYTIDQITIVDPSEISVLAPRSRSSVTLITCYPFFFVGNPPKRYVVQASLTTSSTTNLNTTENGT